MFQNNILKKFDLGELSLILGLVSVASFLMLILLASIGAGYAFLAFACFGFGVFSILFGLIAIFINKGRGSGAFGVFLGIIPVIACMLLMPGLFRF